MSLPELRVLVRTDRDEQVLLAGEMAPIDGDLEEAWLPVQCGNCGATVFLEGHQRGVADREMTATAHRSECQDCGQLIRARVEYVHEQYRAWQPLANPDVDGGEAIEVDDLADRVG